MENRIVIWATAETTYNITSLVHSGDGSTNKGLLDASSAGTISSTESNAITKDLDINLSHQTIPVTAISIPIPSIPFLKDLTCLQLQGNTITVLPREIMLLQGLEELNVSFNAISKIPTEIGYLSKLRDLHMNKNRVKCKFNVKESNVLAFCLISMIDLPQTIGDCRELTVLDISGNQLRQLPIEILLCSKLRNIWLDDNDLLLPNGGINVIHEFPPIPSLVEIGLQTISRSLFPTSLVGSSSNNSRPETGLQRQKSQTGSALGNLDQQVEDQLNSVLERVSTPQATRLIDRILLDEKVLSEAVERENLPFSVVPLLRHPSGICSHCGSYIYIQTVYNNDKNNGSVVIGIPHVAHVTKSERFFPVIYSLCSFRCYYQVLNSLDPSKGNGNTNNNQDHMQRSESSLRSSRSRTF